MKLLVFIVNVVLLSSSSTSSPLKDELHGGLSGLRWSDWDGRQVCKPSAFYLPRTEEDVITIVNSVAKDHGKLKVVGAGHSFSSIALADHGETMMSLDRYGNKMISSFPFFFHIPLIPSLTLSLTHSLTQNEKRY